MVSPDNPPFVTGMLFAVEHRLDPAPVPLLSDSATELTPDQSQVCGPLNCSKLRESQSASG